MHWPRPFERTRRVLSRQEIRMRRNTLGMAWACCCFFVVFGSRAVAADGTASSEPMRVLPESEVSFRHDVMAVLSKAGCNLGTCHGNLNGKGGFFLSLRGQDPAFDYRQLVRDAAGRRINRLEPEESLILLKATARVAHQGGKRFTEASPEFEILRRWIALGVRPPEASVAEVSHLEVTPGDAVLWNDEREIALRVVAHFADGRERDVTRLAVYEASDPLVQISADGVVRFEQPSLGTVLVRYLGAQQPVRLAYRQFEGEFTWDEPAAEHWIDQLVFERLRRLKIHPAPLADDGVFLRRVYLDLLGVLPTAEEARQFVADPAEDKRARLVDRLLEREEFAESWALKWSDLLRNEEKTLDATGVTKLHGWIREAFAENRSLREFAAELVSARGSTYEHPPSNYWRAHREPLVRAETTAQVFLGIRLQCARCHNHPFDHWTQDEYYGWASVFSGIEYEIVDNKRRDNLDKHEFVGDQIVKVTNEGSVKHPNTGEPAEPRFLGETGAIEGDRLERLAEWMTSPDNAYFAKAQVNRIWYHLMGAPLVDPVDDLRATNPASHPELLARLTEQFIADDFRIKPLVRTIVLSRVYQLDTQLNSDEIAEHHYDQRLFARAVVRRLTAEQILDAQSQVLGIPARYEGYPEGTRAGQLAGVERVRRKLDSGDQLLRQFGKPERLLACECERSNEATLGQALSLIGGQQLHARLAAPNNRIGRLMAEHDDLDEVVESLYWAALTRPPSEVERERVRALVAEVGETRPVLEDLVWALLNAKELLFRN